MENQNESRPSTSNEKTLPQSLEAAREAAQISENEVKNIAKEADLEKNMNLIFGKFKNMEEAFKGYKEAERAITRAAMLEKEVKKFQEQLENYEKDIIAREEGYLDRLDRALQFDVDQRELDNYLTAGRYLMQPQQQLMLHDLIAKCRATCNKEDMAAVRRFFSPEVIALASKDTAAFKTARHEEYEKLREEEKTTRYKRKIEEFRKLNGQWASSELYNTLIEQAMDVSGGRVDLAELKKMVEKIETDAIKKYQKKASIQRENSALQDSLRPTESVKTHKQGKKWLTREDYYKLTPEQEAEKYDQIVEQIKLERQGILPRMLTK